MPVPSARFHELLKDIEPSDTTTTRASSAHTRIRDHLRTQEGFKDRYARSFLSGSYARDTAIRPQASADGTERPDVDIIVVTNFTTYDNPDDVLAEVRKALEDDGNGYQVERVNQRSVRVETWQAEMDIVPVCEIPGGYMIPDRETGTWKFTNPPVHTQWSADQNQTFEGRFKRLVKMFKWWRRTRPTSSRKPKGFVLEMLLAMHGPTRETHFGVHSRKRWRTSGRHTAPMAPTPSSRSSQTRRSLRAISSPRSHRRNGPTLSRRYAPTQGLHARRRTPTTWRRPHSCGGRLLVIGSRQPPTRPRLPLMAGLLQRPHPERDTHSPASRRLRPTSRVDSLEILVAYEYSASRL